MSIVLDIALIISEPICSLTLETMDIMLMASIPVIIGAMPVVMLVGTKSLVTTGPPRRALERNAGAVTRTVEVAEGRRSLVTTGPPRRAPERNAGAEIRAVDVAEGKRSLVTTGPPRRCVIVITAGIAWTDAAAKMADSIVIVLMAIAMN